MAVFCDQAVTVWASWLGKAPVYVLFWGGIIGWVPCLSKAAGNAQQNKWEQWAPLAGWGCRLGSAAGKYCKVGSKAAWGHNAGSLIRRGQRLQLLFSMIIFSRSSFCLFSILADHF